MRKRIFLILSITLIIFFGLALVVGSVSVPVLDSLKVLANNLFGANFAVDTATNNIIYGIRLPRVVLAMLVSMALATSGATIQGVYRNPMADTGILGISSGASLGAILSIATGFSAQSIYAMPIFAVAGALLTAFGIFFFASRDGKVPILTLVLTGIAASAFIQAVVSLVLTYMDEGQTEEYLYWSMGSLSSTRWEHVELVYIPIIIGVMLLIWFAKDLNILMLGEEEAQSLGLNPYKIRKKLLLLVSVVTAMAVCVSGGIQFIGLVIPHILRMLMGPDNRYLLPASALGGAIFLIFCDLLSRTLIIPAEIPVGIITSIIGAPYFLYLIEKEKRRVV